MAYIGNQGVCHRPNNNNNKIDDKKQIKSDEKMETKIWSNHIPYNKSSRK